MAIFGSGTVQAREAILSLRRKGYNTYESGFGGFGENEQVVTLQDEGFKNFTIPASLLELMKENGVRALNTPNQIKICFDHAADLQEIKGVWDMIEKEIPSLGKKADMCQTGGARIFRERQKVSEI